MKRPDIEALHDKLLEGPYPEVDAVELRAVCEYALEAVAECERLREERDRLRGWPEIPIPTAGSPIDTYRCENENCMSVYEVWQFRPDDYDLDETILNCPACGEEGELYLRQFRSGYGALNDRSNG